ncbi:MAG: ribulose-phosphate 3-epimerase [Bacteroidia bacterium]|nr:ribulose-phosphate 3-epimerase [Bacteroidia bacterium]MDW8133621.1 ribulose-phosphate 3-epimerase [Bacteroidia bacterium]
MKAPLIFPSLLSADFGRLAEEINTLENLGVEGLHCDIMDGVFVPNISFGLPVLEAIRRYSTKPLDVHLMIQHPERYIEAFARAGADILTFHWEATPHADRLVQQIRIFGKKVGIALNPATPVEVLREILPELDLVCLMGVNPGFGGQTFIPYVAHKLQRLVELRSFLGAHTFIEVDGGISQDTAPLVASADIWVVGSSLLNAPERSAVLQSLRKAHLPTT